ncbi:MAG: response regulator [Gemmatimonadota bacterium]
MGHAGKTVLIVDDERTLLHTFSNSLKAYASDLEILTAEHGLQAVAALKEAPVDLVVTDLRMPEMDGFQLIIHMKKHYPGIPVIVMTAAGSPEVADRMKAMGAVSYLEKPINIKDLALKIFQGIAAASRGRICGVTLAGLLQLIVMERKSCALKIRSGDRSGTLLIKDGDLIDARTEDRSGEAAACEIVTWDDTEIKMGNYTGERTKNIDAALSEILLDAFRMKDERERAARGGGERPEAAPAADRGPQPDKDAARGEGDAATAGERETAPMEERGAAPDAGPPAGAAAGGDLRALLSRLSRLGGVDAACLVGCDGFLIDGIFNEKMEPELVAAIASAGFGASDSIAGELGRGRAGITMFEFDRAAIVIAPVGKDFLLVVVAGSDANLGMLRVKVRKLEGELEAAARAV